MRESWAITNETESQRAELPISYDGDLSVVPRMTFSEAIVAAGGIVSTAADMERFIRLQLGLTSHALSAAAALSQEPHRSYSGDYVRGLGWGIRGDLLNHNGLTNGFTTALYLDRERGVGALVMMNLGDVWGLQATIGTAMLDIASGRQPASWPYPRRTTFNPTTFARCAGSYTILEDGRPEEIAVGVSANQPWIDLNGRWWLTAASDTQFLARNYPVMATCENPVDGRYRALRLRHPSGAELVATRD